MPRNGSRWQNGILKTGTKARQNFGVDRYYVPRNLLKHGLPAIRRRSVTITRRFWLFTDTIRERTTSSCWESRPGACAALRDVPPKSEPEDKHPFDLLKKAYTMRALFDVLSHHGRGACGAAKASARAGRRECVKRVWKRLRTFCGADAMRKDFADSTVAG